MTRHISLVDPTKPAPVCPACQRRAQVDGRTTAASLAAASLAKPIRTLQEEMRALQLAVRAVEADLRRAVDLEQAIDGQHPHCACCGGWVGPGHVVAVLVQEPHGDEWVCDDCASVLKRAKRSAVDHVRVMLVDEGAA